MRNKFKKQYYLVGGGEFDEDINLKIEAKVLKKINRPSVLIIPWTSNNPKILRKYRTIMSGFFKKLGAKKISFLETNDSLKEIKKKFEKADVIYLPGGDTKILLRNILRKRIKKILKDFKGVIMGISAGAYVLTKGYPEIKKTKILISPSLNLVNIYIKAHYTEKLDNILIGFSKTKKNYGIADNSAIMIQGGKIKKIFGKVCLFSRGKKYLLSK